MCKVCPMGAKDVFTNPQFCTSRSTNNDSGNSLINRSAASVAISMMKLPTTTSSVSLSKTSNNNLGCNNYPNNNICGSETSNFMEEEWHQKYAFIIGLLRKPHSVLVKESLSREREKLAEKLSAYRLERNLVRESMNKHMKNG